MSTFGGLIDEIPGISVDRFDNGNLNSKVFFLSHCHSDHMRGLDEAKDGLPGPLYLSEVSRVFVQRKFPHLTNLKKLDIGQSAIVPLNGSPSNDDSGADDDNKAANHLLTVTSIPAGHCPGSVMFMFEYDGKRVLYTGDFRLDEKTIKRITTFRNDQDDLLKFDSLYIDSTFLFRRYLNFPTQQQSVDAIVELTRAWLLKNDSNSVAIRMPANYGYEFMLGELAKNLKKAIHIDSANAGDYSYLPELDGTYTGCMSKDVRIHFQCGNDQMGKWKQKFIACCPSLAPKHIRIIRPTAMKWENWRQSDPIYELYDEVPEIYSVCYSNHSSFTEIKQLIQFIRAENVEFNVMPSNGDGKREMLDAYKQIVGDSPDKSLESEADRIITFSRIVIDCERENRSKDKEDCTNRPKLKRRKRN